MAHANQQVSDREIIAQFEAAAAPYLTASEIAESVSISRQAAHKRLMALHEEGRIARKKTGRTVGWWLNSSGG